MKENKKPVFSMVELVIIIILGLLIITLWVYSPYFLRNHFASIDKRGQFGDSFGMITSLFNAFAFFALIVTLIIQKRELTYQREEFEESRIAQQDIVKENQNNINLQILLSHTSYLKIRADQIGNDLRQVIASKGDTRREDLMNLQDEFELFDYFKTTSFTKEKQALYTELSSEYFKCINKYKNIQDNVFSKKADKLLSSEVFNT
jgi:hypothetical protein